MIRQLNRLKWVLAAVSVATLSACASYDVQKGLDRVNSDTKELTQGELQLARTESDRHKRQALTSKILAKQLGPTESVQLMLANSPAFQSLMAQNWSDAASAAQSGRISNPVFSYESVVTGSETEINRFLSFGLLDLLTLPQRSAMAEFRIEQTQLKFAAEVIDRVTQVKQAWVKAVAAEQSFVYAKQVYESAQVSAELARRMEAVGNFNRLTRARHQAFYADAATQLVTAKQNAMSKREELVRLLGLDQEQAQLLTLPTRLPEIPKQPMSDEEVGQQASRNRLDIQLAKANLNASAKEKVKKRLKHLLEPQKSVIINTLNNVGMIHIVKNPILEVLENISTDIINYDNLNKIYLYSEKLSTLYLKVYKKVIGNDFGEIKDSKKATYKKMNKIMGQYKEQIDNLKKATMSIFM